MESASEPLKIRLIVTREKPKSLFNKTAVIIGISVWLTALIIVSYYCFENEVNEFSSQLLNKLNNVLDFDGEGESLITAMRHTDNNEDPNEPQSCSRDSKDSCGFKNDAKIPTEKPKVEVKPKESMKVSEQIPEQQAIFDGDKKFTGNNKNGANKILSSSKSKGSLKPSPKNKDSIKSSEIPDIQIPENIIEPKRIEKKVPVIEVSEPTFIVENRKLSLEESEPELQPLTSQDAPRQESSSLDLQQGATSDHESVPFIQPELSAPPIQIESQQNILQSNNYNELQPPEDTIFEGDATSSENIAESFVDVPPKTIDYNPGEIRSAAMDKCVDAGSFEGAVLSLYTCHGLGGNQNWTYDGHDEIRKGDLCADFFGGPSIYIFNCHGKSGNQKWLYTKQTFYHPNSNTCLTLLDASNIGMQPCEDNRDTQRWIWRYTESTTRVPIG